MAIDRRRLSIGLLICLLLIGGLIALLLHIGILPGFGLRAHQPHLIIFGRNNIVVLRVGQAVNLTAQHINGSC